MVGPSETQVIRAWRPPQACGSRLDAARRRVVDGEPLADVAGAVGFADQAHLSRPLTRFLGTTSACDRSAGRIP